MTTVIFKGIVFGLSFVALLVAAFFVGEWLYFVQADFTGYYSPTAPINANATGWVFSILVGVITVLSVYATVEYNLQFNARGEA